jgi:aryl-alcohol dehydrogenase-like predicted oxidoreductase
VDQAAQVLNGALDAGINFLDTAACYGISEELIGRTVAHRRDEYVLATKAGHFIPRGQGQDWTAEVVSESIDRSLRRLKTDRLDIVQLHSCGVDVLERGDVIRVLQDAKAAGKLRHVSYSGDNESAHWAVDSGLFDTLQTSFNITDQRARASGLLKKAEERGMGIIIKRPIGGGSWARAKRGEASRRGYDSQYAERARAMAAEGDLPGEPENSILLALGFTLGHAEPDVAIVGTKSPEHMVSNIEMVEKGLPLDGAAIEELHARWERHGGEWRQLG